MSPLKNVLIALSVGVFFALLYVAGILNPLEERVYDVFLRGRPERQRISNLVFLDVDDTAVAYNGVFPWPRSIMADGFLRLKEYGAAAAILDIEFIDKGPQGIDTVYFNQGLPGDFENAFSGISVNVSDLLEAVGAGRIDRKDIPFYEGELLKLIRDEKEGLFQRTAGVARDNDEYLAQASALFGHTWATLNLQSKPLSGEQAERRPLAEEKFYYPLEAAPESRGGEYVDILPPIPSFSSAARGAGFTNVFVDPDGVRRRIFLAQKVYDRWYLQLAFAPLMEYLGNPEIRLEKRRLILKNARFPEAAGPQDLAIPLDTGGRMMLDWPKTNYHDSFTHISFAEFSHLEEQESLVVQYLTLLEDTDILFFAQFDESLYPIPGIIRRVNECLAAAREERNRALAETSGEAFDRSLAFRTEGLALVHSLAESDLGETLRALGNSLGRDYPENAEALIDEAEYIITLVEYLEIVLEQYEAARDRIGSILEGKFCIIGRVDTGTTDIGVNPFYNEYVNVGTHGVVLDTILSQSFINPVHPFWSAFLCIILSVLTILGLRGLSPGLRGAVGFGTAILIGGVSFGVFRFSGFFICPLGPVFSVILAVFIRELVAYVLSEQEKQFINKAFSTYLSGEVVKELIADPSNLKLGGIKRHMSAVFTDIQSFSSISEKLEPTDLVRLLNIYLTEMSDIIMENRGTIDKYEGDAIIAFFGAPVYREDHAVLACRSAVQIKKAERTLNERIVLEDLSPSPLFTRIGINTGEMVVGNMGTENKMNYTIMGNDVNLAARLEGVNKQYHTGGILISEYTRKEIGDEFICRTLDRVRVVGINTPLRLYEITGFWNEAAAAEIDAFAAWETAIRLYEMREFSGAEEIFTLLASGESPDGTAELYAGRCRSYIQTPPPPDWVAITNLTEK